MANPSNLTFVEAWRALSEDTTKLGWNTLPVATSSNCLLLAGRHQPSNRESMLIGFTVPELPKQASLPQSKGFSLELAELPFQSRRYFCLAITRQQSASVELFTAMLDDIVAVLERSNRSESEHIAVVIERIVGWQRFMSRNDDGILKAEAELGLVGELNLLRLLLVQGVGATEAVNCWQGPSDSLHDFVCPRGDIEVKSSARVGAFAANVGSLDQLDESLVQPLYMAAVQFSLSASGLRLPQHVDSVRQLLIGEAEARSAFEGKLLAAGYHQALVARYNRQFSYLRTSFFEITGNFPRLTKGNVPVGVVDASYRFEIDGSKFSALTLSEVLKQIG